MDQSTEFLNATRASRDECGCHNTWQFMLLKRPVSTLAEQVSEGFKIFGRSSPGKLPATAM